MAGPERHAWRHERLQHQGARLTAAGAPVGTEILVNTATANNQSVPQITALSNGGFVVTWSDNSLGVGGATGDTSYSAVKAQIFGPTGSYMATEQVALSLKGGIAGQRPAFRPWRDRL